MGRLLISLAATKVCAKSKLLHAGPRKERKNYFTFDSSRVYKLCVSLHAEKKLLGTRYLKEGLNSAHLTVGTLGHL